MVFTHCLNIRLKLYPDVADTQAGPGRQALALALVDPSKFVNEARSTGAFSKKLVQLFKKHFKPLVHCKTSTIQSTISFHFH